MWYWPINKQQAIGRIVCALITPIPQRISLQLVCIDIEGFCDEWAKIILFFFLNWLLDTNDTCRFKALTRPDPMNEAHQPFVAHAAAELSSNATIVNFAWLSFPGNWEEQY